MSLSLEQVTLTHQNLLIRIIFQNGVANPFSAKPAVFDPAVRHVVEAQGWDILDDDPSHIQCLKGLMGAGHQRGEEAGLESEGAVIDRCEDLFEIAEGRHTHDGAKGFLACQWGALGDLTEDSGLQVAAVLLGATMTECPIRNGRIYPSDEKITKRLAINTGSSPASRSRASQ